MTDIGYEVGAHLLGVPRGRNVVHDQNGPGVALRRGLKCCHLDVETAADRRHKRNVGTPMILTAQHIVYRIENFRLPQCQYQGAALYLCAQKIFRRVIGANNCLLAVDQKHWVRQCLQNGGSSDGRQFGSTLSKFDKFRYDRLMAFANSAEKKARSRCLYLGRSEVGRRLRRLSFRQAFGEN